VVLTKFVQKQAKKKKGISLTPEKKKLLKVRSFMNYYTRSLRFNNSVGPSKAIGNRAARGHIVL